VSATPNIAAPGTITLTIDGQLVTARQGETLLDVFREHAVDVPTLCEFEGLSCVGACRLCLVEVVGRPKLVAACVTAAEEGMEARTTTERLVRYRTVTLELLLAERNHVCSVCVMNGHCDLQTLVAISGVDHVELEYQYPKALAVDVSHPRFGMDPNRCILCTRCVRVCDEIEGAHAWDVAGRGTGARVIQDLAVPWGQSVTCTGCAKCVQVCPTGALFEKGATVAEMVKHRDHLRFLSTARRERRWMLDMAARQTNGALQ
jgi:bidirectional [NiFe] hydrogenase diaphorase subunit